MSTAFGGYDKPKQGKTVVSNHGTDCEIPLSSPKAAQDRLMSWLDTKPKKLSLDTDPPNLSQDQVQLRRLFIGTEAAYLQSIFKILSKDDIHHIQLLVNTGELQVTEQQKAQLSNLVNFIKNDPSDVLWDEDGAMSALTTKYPDYRGPGYKSNLGGMIGGLDTSTITSIEREIVNEALTGTSPRFERGGVLRRFWSPQYYHVQRILTFFNWIRGNLDHVQEVGQTLKEVLSKAVQFRLTSKQSADINNELNLMTVEQRKKLRQLSEEVIGQDVFTGGYQGTGRIGLHQLSKKIRSGKAAEAMDKDAIVIESEKAMDLIDNTLNENRKSNNEKPRMVSDYFDTELKVRHRQYHRENQSYHNSYIQRLDDESKETLYVHYSWTETETETYTDSDGKTQTRTKTVTRYGSGTFNVLYSDIILHHLDTFKTGASFDRGHWGATIDSVTGLGALKNRVQRIISTESAYNYKLGQLERALQKRIEEDHINVVSQAKVNPSSLQTYINELQALKKEMSDLLGALEKYHKLSQNEVLNQWSGDNYQHFKLRAAELNVSTVFLYNLFDVYIEQVKRLEYELVITPDKPDYSSELNKLKWALIGNIAAKSAIGVGAVTHGIACTPSVQYYGWTVRAADACVQSVWGDLIQNLLSVLPQ